MSATQEGEMLGWIQLRGLRCVAPSGDGEQLLVVDVAVQLDLAAAARSDAYVDTIDIADLAATVRDVIGGPPRVLLETVAVHLARVILDTYAHVRQVHLRVAKSEPPGLEAAEEAIELRLERSAS